MMSFSTDENSVWFNNNKYGVWLIKGIKDITDNSTNEEITKVLGPATDAHLSGKKYPAGTNVACINNTSTTEHTEANWDPLGGTVDLSAYATKTEMNNGLSGKINTSAIKNDLTTGGLLMFYLPNKVRY